MADDSRSEWLMGVAAGQATTGPWRLVGLLVHAHLELRSWQRGDELAVHDAAARGAERLFRPERQPATVRAVHLPRRGHAEVARAELRHELELGVVVSQVALAEPVRALDRQKGPRERLPLAAPAQPGRTHAADGVLAKERLRARRPGECRPGARARVGLVLGEQRPRLALGCGRDASAAQLAAAPLASALLASALLAAALL
eukprot:CAMPEP_0185515814 /NCGR_PEP_ID=MMETSP1366-20130426/63741_1 /TAXON_ID=38817 /ORGANISM="Gephyrocapsa oceanica, Strain RCC1303" /LENGTH=201 /DNA_ID=CAMNT_0028126679 /DNA_START=211 /DNA_END=813 /DNA_ORIENTATION=+